jgi:hypothetical protein
LHAYRLYVYGKDGELIGPASPIPADDDAAAIAGAEERVNGLDAELRDELRLVKKFAPEHFARRRRRI